MTRAFGDKVGASVGVTAQPEIRQVGFCRTSFGREGCGEFHWLANCQLPEFAVVADYG